MRFLTALVFASLSLAATQDRCATCSGSGTVTQRCSACNGTGIGERTERRIFGCEACGGERGDGIYTGKQGTGLRTGRCPSCDGTGESAKAVRERRERQRAAAEAYQKRLEEEARRRMEERARELREANEKLQRELKTSQGSDLKLKTKDTGAPHDAMYGNPSRDSGEGFKIKRTIAIGGGEIRISDLAFEQLRQATWLLEKAEARGKKDEEAEYLSDQAEKAMTGARLDVVVPTADKTPSVTSLIGDYKDLAFRAALDESRTDFLGEKRAAIESRLSAMLEKRKKLVKDISAVGADEDSIKKRKELEDQIKALDQEFAMAGEEWMKLRPDEEAARKLWRGDVEKLEGFRREHPIIPIAKGKGDSKPEVAAKCDCGGDGCRCIRPLCGGLRGCSCADRSVDCACSKRICRFAGTEWCCFGSHQDGDVQRCQTTCACKYEHGKCACSTSCTCSKRKK